MGRKKKHTAEEAAEIPIGDSGAKFKDILAEFLKAPPMPDQKPERRKAEPKRPGRKKSSTGSEG